jgi:hypothetical protein
MNVRISSFVSVPLEKENTTFGCRRLERRQLAAFTLPKSLDS